MDYFDHVLLCTIAVIGQIQEQLEHSIIRGKIFSWRWWKIFESSIESSTKFELIGWFLNNFFFFNKIQPFFICKSRMYSKKSKWGPLLRWKVKSIMFEREEIFVVGLSWLGLMVWISSHKHQKSYKIGFFYSIRLKYIKVSIWNILRYTFVGLSFL